MSDIVEVFEKHASSYNWQFSYGNKYNQNLLQSDLAIGRIYMILDPVVRLRSFSQYGGSGNQTFTGSFLLVVKSTIDQVYHNQTNEDTFHNRVISQGGTIIENACATDSDYVAGKYIENIKPLLNTEIVKLEDDLNCSKYEITNWSIIDVVNALDANTDGILVTYGVKALN